MMPQGENSGPLPNHSAQCFRLCPLGDAQTALRKECDQPGTLSEVFVPCTQRRQHLLIRLLEGGDRSLVCRGRCARCSTWLAAVMVTSGDARSSRLCRRLCRRLCHRRNATAATAGLRQPVGSEKVLMCSPRMAIAWEKKPLPREIMTCGACQL